MDEILNYMRAPVKSIGAQSTAQEGGKLMTENKLSSLLVKDKDNFVGIVTQADIVREVVVKGRDPKTTSMKSIMSQPVITMDHYMTRRDANDLMHKKKIKHLAITREGQIVGIVTLKDMLS
jgi:signal-transduction protein with cAMP-binding, CBS, and nucleotidyltransferase domain